MTVQWPEDLKGFFSICQFLLLDIDSYGFSCIAGCQERKKLWIDSGARDDKGKAKNRKTYGNIHHMCESNFQLRMMILVGAHCLETQVPVVSPFAGGQQFQIC